MNNKIKIIAILLLLFFTSFVFYAKDYYSAMPYAEKIYEVNGDLEFKSNNKKLGFIIYPGGKVDEIAYAPLAQLLNDNGYTVSIANFPLKLGILNSDYMDKIITNYPDIENWVIIGHSLGGVSATNYISKKPEKISGIVYLASYSTKNLKELPLKTISIIGTEDKILNYENYEKSKINYNEKFKEYKIHGGNHGYFGYYGEQDGDGKALISREEQHEQAVNIILNEFSK